MEWKNEVVVVVGAGRSGVAAAELLAHAGARPVITDTRPREELPHLATVPPGVELALGGHAERLWQGASAAIVSPGIPASAPPVETARGRGLRVLSEIELAAGFARAPAVAVTGSNGKSTVTTMVSAILERAGLRAPACGNIGVAFSRLVLEVLRGQRRIDRYVLELSSFQTESIERFRPHWACVLNVSPDHLDRHRDLDGYGRAKLRIAVNCTADDWFVYGASDPWVASRLPAGPRLVPFADAVVDAAPAAWCERGSVHWRDLQGAVHTVLAPGELGVMGAHNLLNAAAAIALACLAGAPPAAAAAVLGEFQGLEHRMESCGQVRGVRCVNDSKATNVGATAASLGGLDVPVWLILGGRDKDSDFNRLRPLLREKVRRVLLIGEATGRIAASLRGAVPMVRCGDMERAVDTALAAAHPGEVLLLAPACTSFDQYRDFEHRGRHFKQIVTSLAAGER